MSNDSDVSNESSQTNDTNRTNQSDDRRAFTFEATALGVGVVILIVVAIATLVSLAGGDAEEQPVISAAPEQPSPTFDASISDDDRTGIQITDEPIVIDANGNIVDPDGGNDGAPLPSESNDRGDGDDAAAAGDDATADGDADADADADSADEGTNLFGGDAPEDKRMPDLYCRGLQAAQDEIQDHGVFGSRSQDATGAGRRQLWDRNWVVVDQEPDPGEKIGEFEAVLHVVKKSDDENPCD